MRYPLLLVLFLTGTLCFSQQLQLVPVPADPHELVTGLVRVLDQTDQRASVLGLIERARQNSDLHAPGGPAFDLKVSFEAAGDVAQTGSGAMEEIWQKPGQWLWKAHLGSYTQTRLMNERMFDENPTMMPLRLQMVRGAIFWPIHTQPNELLRISAGTWNGQPVMCVLGSRPMSNAAEVTGRSWSESEFCIDTKSGLLQTYSVAPGIYAVYDYTNAVRFHASLLPRAITVYESGAAMLTVHLDSITDAGQVDSKVFTPSAKMLSQGTGPIIAGPYRFAMSARNAPEPITGATRPVVVHALLDTEGKVEEAESLQTADSTLSAAAVALVRNSTYAPQERGRPLQREAFISVLFAPQAQASGQ